MLAFLGGLLAKLFCLFSKKKRAEEIKKNFEEFLEKEHDEVEELKNNEETFSEYCEDSCSIFVDYFIPHKSNEYKPKILRTRALITIAFLIFAFKIIATSYVFFVYPFKAQMSADMSVDVLDLINEERVKNDLVPLEINKNLKKAAIAKAEDMFDSQYFSHYGPDGKKPWDWINVDEYQYTFVGENLAMDFLSAQSAHKALMASESHKKNILNEKYRDIGISVLRGEMDGERTLVLVQMFARPQEIVIEREHSKTIANIKTQEEMLELVKKENKDLTILEIENVNNNITPDFQGTGKVAGVTQEIKIHNGELSLGARILVGLQYGYIVVFILAILILFINVVIKVGVQHKGVIIETMFFILFVGALTIVNKQILDKVIEQILII